MKYLKIGWIVPSCAVGSLTMLPMPAEAADVRITKILALDAGASGDGELTVDTSQNICDALSNPPVEEEFSDTMLKVTVTNEQSSIVRFNKISYSIPRPGTGKRVFHSRKLALSSSGEVNPDESVELLAFFADMQGSSKFFVGSSSAIPSDLGFRNVTVRLYGVDGGGAKVSIKARVALSFDNFNRCN